MRKVKEKNYLDFIPVYNPDVRFEIDSKKQVTIFQKNKGLFNKIAQKFFKKPEISQIHLDEFGNFIWPLIDGKKSILDISVLVKEEFKEKSEPLYERLVKYFSLLNSYNFISLVEQDSHS